jgi:hypothetical protein
MKVNKYVIDFLDAFGTPFFTVVTYSVDEPGIDMFSTVFDSETGEVRAVLDPHHATALSVRVTKNS